MKWQQKEQSRIRKRKRQEIRSEKQQLVPFRVPIYDERRFS